MSQLSTSPSIIEFGAGEQWSPGIDFTGALSDYTPGTVPTNPACVLTDAGTGQVVQLSTAPTVTGMVVLQQIDRASVIAGHLYNLVVRVTPSGTTNRREVMLQIKVPQGS